MIPKLEKFPLGQKFILAERFAKDLKAINLKSYEHSARLVDAIGTSIGGWLKFSSRENLPKPV